MSRWLSVAQVAHELGVSPSTVRNMIAAGDLHAYQPRPRARVLVPRTALDRLEARVLDQPVDQSSPQATTAGDDWPTGRSGESTGPNSGTGTGPAARRGLHVRPAAGHATPPALGATANP